jgi:phenylacetate-CoA ligase
VARAIDEVPLYAGRPAPPSSAEGGGDDPQAVSRWLQGLPTLHKRDLRRGFPKALVRREQDLKAEMASGKVEIISTSGTTEDRLQIIWGDSWWDPQEREAMRYNRVVAAAMDGAASYREAVLTTPVCGGSTCHVGNLSLAERTIDGMLFLNQVADPTHWNSAELDRMVAEWNDLKPDGVEADPAYLAALCRHARSVGAALHSPKYVTLTYELSTHGQRRAISQAIASPLYDLYGATEAGVLFMQCTEGRLHHNARHSHIELFALGPDLGRVVVTTLGRPWMPLVRYALSDVVRLAPRGPCPCGRDQGGYLLSRVEGRFSDCVRVDFSDGPRWVTPAMLDDDIDDNDPEVQAWQLERRGPEREGWLLRVVGSDGRAAANAVEALLLQPVTPQAEAAILPEGSGKYRLVRAS